MHTRKTYEYSRVLPRNPGNYYGTLGSSLGKGGFASVYETIKGGKPSNFAIKVYVSENRKGEIEADNNMFQTMI